MRHIDLLHVLSNHRDKVGYLAWSPDDRMLLTMGGKTILIWSTEVSPSSRLDETSSSLADFFLRLSQTWTCTKTLAHYDQPITAVRWLPDGSGFLCSVDDGKIYRYVRLSSSFSLCVPLLTQASLFL